MWFGLLLFASAPALDTELVPTVSARNALYFESTGRIVDGSLSANFERRFWYDRLAFRFGVGAFNEPVRQFFNYDERGAFGVTAGLKWLSHPERKIHLELGAGVSVMEWRTSGCEYEDSYDPENQDDYSTADCLALNGETRVYPAADIAFRYQPPRAGIFMKLGLAYNFGQAGPLTYALGFVF
ncbi:MAG: hypothetical protein AAFU77_14815 [Myxococcota bacterium]